MSQQDSHQAKVGIVFLGRRRPGFDMEWGKAMEQRVREWLPQSGFSIFEPGEKAVDDASLRRVMDDWHRPWLSCGRTR